ncbi:hypothetical protein TYRP_019207 [Tyrophagus putrescentiae]|nr:hypothetical protein TYRP_019207 [Tyrophagus putrescentiae]
MTPAFNIWAFFSKILNHAETSVTFVSMKTTLMWPILVAQEVQICKMRQSKFSAPWRENQISWG